MKIRANGWERLCSQPGCIIEKTWLLAWKLKHFLFWPEKISGQMDKRIQDISEDLHLVCSISSSCNMEINKKLLIVAIYWKNNKQIKPKKMLDSTAINIEYYSTKKLKFCFLFFHIASQLTQQTFTCSKSTIETLKKVKYVLS